MDRINRDIPLQHQFLYETIKYELKKHDWNDDDSCHKAKIRGLINDAYDIDFDPCRLFYEFCPVEGIDEKEYGMKKTWEETMDEIATEANIKETVR